MTEEAVQTVDYRGEPARRSPTVAFLLTLMCPGLGSAYLGSALKAALTALLFASAAGAFVSLWTALKFFPALPLVVFIVGWVAVATMLGLDAAKEAEAVGDDYILKGTNHPIVYLAIALVAYLLPLAGLASYTGNRLWTLVWVQGDSMYPTLAEGDLLLVDQTAYLNDSPDAGDLVLFQVEVGGDQTLLLGRIIGLPNDEVAVMEASPIIGGEPLPRGGLLNQQDAPGYPELANLLAGVGQMPGTLTFTERNRGVGYLTAESHTTMGTMFEPIVLGHSEYYVLYDNRSQFGDSRELGALLRDQIVGEAVFVAYSNDPNDGVRWERVARRVQPAPYVP